MTSCGNGGERVQMCAVLKLFQPCSYVFLEMSSSSRALDVLTTTLNNISSCPLPFGLFLWILQVLSSCILLSADLIFDADRSPFCWLPLAYFSFFNNSLLLGHSTLISSAQNRTAAFCPLQAVKLETLTSRSLAFPPTGCTKWFSVGLGGLSCLPANKSSHRHSFVHSLHGLRSRVQG